MRRLYLPVVFGLIALTGCINPISRATRASLNGDILTIEFLHAHGPSPSTVYLVEFEPADWLPLKQRMEIEPPVPDATSPEVTIANGQYRLEWDDPVIDTKARLIAVCHQPEVAREFPAAVSSYQWNERYRRQHLCVDLAPLPSGLIDRIAGQEIYAIGVTSNDTYDDNAFLLPIERAKPFNAVPYLIILAVWLICLGIPLTWLWLSGRKQQEDAPLRRLPAGQE